MQTPLDVDSPPFALTEQHIAALARAIEAEGYRIMADPETGNVKLEWTSARGRGGFVLLSGIDHEGYEYESAFDSLDEAVARARKLQRPRRCDFLAVYDVSSNEEVFSSTHIGYGNGSKWVDSVPPKQNVDGSRAD
jgi:hypothetical protein